MMTRTSPRALTTKRPTSTSLTPLARKPPTSPADAPDPATPSYAPDQSATGLARTPAPKPTPVSDTPSVPANPPAIRSQLTPALPVATPAAIQPALDTPGAPAISPTASPAPASTPTGQAPQTESGNPLTGASGDTGQQMEGTTKEVPNPAQALGFSQRGPSAPQGADAMPKDESVGGTGLYAKRFKNPKSASIYDTYVKKLFGNGSQVAG